jgi:hypothetical protein
LGDLSSITYILGIGSPDAKHKFSVTVYKLKKSLFKAGLAFKDRNIRLAEKKYVKKMEKHDKETPKAR